MNRPAGRRAPQPFSKRSHNRHAAIVAPIKASASDLDGPRQEASHKLRASRDRHGWSPRETCLGKSCDMTVGGVAPYGGTRMSAQRAGQYVAWRRKAARLDLD